MMMMQNEALPEDGASRGSVRPRCENVIVGFEMDFLKCFLNSVHHRRAGHKQSRHDNSFDFATRRHVFGKESKTPDSVVQYLDLAKSRCVSIRHSDCLYHHIPLPFLRPVREREPQKSFVYNRSVKIDVEIFLQGDG